MPTDTISRKQNIRKDGEGEGKVVYLFFSSVFSSMELVVFGISVGRGGG